MSDLLNLPRITSLALADSVNPCAIAVLAMVLISIMTQDHKKKIKVLYGGIAFVSAVYLGYLVYGTIIIEFFKLFAEWSRENSIYFYNTLAIVSMIIGALQIKDYFYYQPGGIATEMPLWMRPYARLTIKKINSTFGAFIIGLFVTLFLLPCTIGPYIVASGILAEIGLLKSIPWLLYYNLIFILPMIAIVLIVYFGISKIEDISDWKERKIKLLHLISGILMLAVGISLLAGWL